MKYNPVEVSQLRPDYMGFIFYDKSPRNFTDNGIPSLPEGIKKVGVFVKAEIDFIIEKCKKLGLDVIQLHGEETADYCTDLKTRLKTESIEIDLWKVFSIKDKFDFSVLKNFEPAVDKFLFDTKGKEKGGNGYTFDWQLLKEYPSTKPFILSGGIGLQELDKLKSIFETRLPIYAVDVNSKFEDKPGLKNIKDLKKFIDEL